MEMIPEDLMRKYKYGYVHSCELLEEPFIKDLLKENQELKKQLEERNIEYFKGAYDTHDKYYTQQKDFIKYLEDEIEQNIPGLKWKHFNEDVLNDYDVENPIYIEMQPTNKVLKEILQKYKEIIGDDK